MLFKRVALIFILQSVVSRNSVNTSSDLLSGCGISVLLPIDVLIYLVLTKLKIKFAMNAN